MRHTDKIIYLKAIQKEMHFGRSGKSSTSLTFVEMVSITFAYTTVQMNIRGLIRSAHSKQTSSWPARACKENKRSWYIFSFSIIPSSYIGTSTTSSIHLRFCSAVFTSYIMAIRTGHKPPPFIKPLHLPFGFRSSHKTLWL